MSARAPERWSDKTMSVLRERQLEACQDRLTRRPSQSIFDDLCDDEAKAIYDYSYYLQETHQKFPGAHVLRERVMDCLPREVCFLSQRENELVQRMLIADGQTTLNDWDEIAGAEALISRLWCSLEIQDDEIAVLHLADQLMMPLLEAVLSSEYSRMRELLFRFDATLHSLLYLSGFLHSAAPVEHFRQLLRIERMDRPEDDWLIARYLRAAFDYTQAPQGDILLLHPGLADPDMLLSSLSGMQGKPELHLTQEMMLGGMNGMLPEEVASCEGMRGALSGAVRPEYDEEEVLEDLRMMAKQGAGLPEMQEVLESMLCVLPTPRMLSALAQLHLQTVRWMGMPSGVLN